MYDAAMSTPSDLSSPSSRGSPVNSPQSASTHGITAPRRQVAQLIYTNKLYDVSTPTPVHGSITLREHDGKAATVNTPELTLDFKSHCQFSSPSTQIHGLTATEVRRGVQRVHLDMAEGDLSNQKHPAVWSHSPITGLDHASTGFGKCAMEPAHAHLKDHSQTSEADVGAQQPNVLANALRDLHSSPTPGGAAEVAQMLFSAPPRSCQQFQGTCAVPVFHTPSASVNHVLENILADSLSAHEGLAPDQRSHDMADPSVQVDTHARLNALLCTPSAHQSPSTSRDPLYDQLLQFSVDDVPVSDSVTPVSKVINAQHVRPRQLQQPDGHSPGSSGTAPAAGTDLVQGISTLGRGCTGSLLATHQATSSVPGLASAEPSEDKAGDPLSPVSAEGGLSLPTKGVTSIHQMDAGVRAQEQQLPGNAITIQQHLPQPGATCCTHVSRQATAASSPRTPPSNSDAQSSPFTLAELVTSCPSEVRAHATPGSWLVSGKGIRESMECGIENLPELSDEQFAHASMLTAADCEPILTQAVRPPWCKPARESEIAASESLIDQQQRLASLHFAGIVSSVAQPTRLSKNLGIEPNELMDETVLRRSITDLVTNSAATKAVPEVQHSTQCVDGARIVDLAPPALPSENVHPPTSNQSTAASAVKWMPMFAGTMNVPSIDARKSRDAFYIPKPDAFSDSAAEVPDSPCSRPLTNSSTVFQRGVARPEHKRAMPCPPLPKGPCFGTLASPRHLTPARSLQFSPEVVSPNIRRTQSLGSSPATRSPFSLTTTSSAPMLPLSFITPDQSRAERANSDSTLYLEREELVPARFAAEQSGQRSEPCAITSVATELDGAQFVIQSHPSLQQASADGADSEDLSSHASGDSCKENGPQAISSPVPDVPGQVMPPTLCCLSPRRPSKRASHVLGVRLDGLQETTSYMHDPATSPGNPDCGHRWSLNSPQAGLLQGMPVRLPVGHQSPIHNAERDQAGPFGGDCAKPAHICVTPDHHSTGSLVQADNATQSLSLRLQNSCEALPCITPLRAHGDCVQGNSARCRSVHMRKPCQSMSSPSGRCRPSPVHVMPWRANQRTAGSSCISGSRVGWEFRMPDRTPLNVQSGHLRCAVSDLDQVAFAESCGLTNVGSAFNEGCCERGIQLESAVNQTSALRRLYSCRVQNLWTLLWWAIHTFNQYRDAVLSAWRTAVVPKQSWILLGGFAAASMTSWIWSSVSGRAEHEGPFRDRQDTADSADVADLPAPAEITSADRVFGGIDDVLPESQVDDCVVAAANVLATDPSLAIHLPIVASVTKRVQSDPEAVEPHAPHSTNTIPSTRTQPPLSSQDSDKEPAQLPEPVADLCQKQDVRHVRTFAALHSVPHESQECKLHSSTSPTRASHIQSLLHSCQLMPQLMLPSIAQDDMALAMLPVAPQMSEFTPPTKAEHSTSMPHLEQDERVVIAQAPVFILPSHSLKTETSDSTLSCESLEPTCQGPPACENCALQECTSGCANCEPQVVCDASWSGVGSNVSGPSGDKQETTDVMADMIAAGHEEICNRCLGGLPVMKTLDISAANPRHITHHLEHRIADSGMLQLVDPWLLPSGVRWLMSVLVIGCISAIATACCRNRFTTKRFADPRHTSVADSA